MSAADDRSWAQRDTEDGAAAILVAQVLICEARGYHQQAYPVTVPARCADCGVNLTD